MKRLFVIILLAIFSNLAFTNIAFANEAKPMGDDPALEARLKNVSQELRCLVCQNTTLADSSAPLAEDLRREIRVLMREGKTDKEVVEYLVARYGDFVLYRPPVKNSTAFLWFGPFIILIIGAFVLYRVLKKHAGSDDIQGEDA
jgi:cytochrome c-type biogenesis protein CcmH